MLTLLGRAHRMCDGLSRRSFLKLGGLAMGAAGGMGLPTLLEAEAAAGVRNSSKAVINVFLAGGPPHQDLWDIKEAAPSEIRGEFAAIDTNVGGVRIGECFPKVAAMFDKFTAIRSIVRLRRRARRPPVPDRLAAERPPGRSAADRASARP